MKNFLTAVAIVATTIACGPRPVQVQTGPQPTTEVTLHVTNNLSQAVNVYVAPYTATASDSGSGSDIFLKQVDANSNLSISVPGIVPGRSVTLKATVADGSRTYTRENVTLSGTYEWQVP